MKPLLILILVFTLTACRKEVSTPASRKAFYKSYHVDIKYCVDVCIRHHLGNFHNSSSQFLGGAASSSLPVGEQNVFTRVINYCKGFYTTTTCCKSFGMDSDLDVHSLYFGACDKRYLQ